MDEVERLRAENAQLLMQLRKLMLLAQGSKGPEWVEAVSEAARLIEKITGQRWKPPAK